MQALILFMVMNTSLLFALSNEVLAYKSDAQISGFIDSSSQMKMELINASGQTRIRYMNMQVLEGSEADKSLMEFQTPADVKGTKFLSYEYILKDDDQWLYLPALKRVKRISSKNKSGAFMGSEFSYEDLGSFNSKKYIYEGEADEGVFNSKQVYIGSMKALSKHSGYSSLRTYIDKETYLIYKIEYFDRKRELLKRALFSGYKKIKGIYRVGKIRVDNIQNDKTTILTWSEDRIKIGLKEKDFHKRHLKR